MAGIVGRGDLGVGELCGGLDGLRVRGLEIGGLAN